MEAVIKWAATAWNLRGNVWTTAWGTMGDGRPDTASAWTAADFITAFKSFESEVMTTLKNVVNGPWRAKTHNDFRCLWMPGEVVFGWACLISIMAAC